VDRDDPWLTYGGLAVILGLILLLNWRYRRMKAADRVAT
jgi:LPXTG-motif cell wall-anchored protein